MSTPCLVNKSNVLRRRYQTFCSDFRAPVLIVKNSPDLLSAGLSAMYTATDTIVDVTELMDVEAIFHASVSSAAGLPRISSL